MILKKEDILKLVTEYEQEMKLFEVKKKEVARQRPDWTKGAFNRTDFYRDILSDNYVDGFIMNYPHGTVIKQAEANWFFRGERICYPNSQPTFVRRLKEKTQEEALVFEFVKNTKLIDFKLILNQFTHFREFENMGIKMPNGFRRLSVLLSNIAQHYGFDTNWLDITSDFNAALFFACCTYENSKWRPLTAKEISKDEKTKHGRIFRRKADFITNSRMDGKYRALPVGYQPFMRCHMQYSYGIWMDESMDLTEKESGFEMLKFEHSEELSQYVFEKMQNGNKIYPQEGLKIIEEELEDLKNRKVISENVFKLTYKAMELELPPSKLKKLLKENGYILDGEALTINPIKIKLVNEFYKDFDIEDSYGIKLSGRFIYTP